MPAFFPPTFAMTLPPSTSGDPAAPKKPFVDLELAHRIDVPHGLPGCERYGVQLPFRAVRVHQAIGHDGHRARSFIEAEIVSIRCGIRVPPLRCAGQGVE